MPKLLIALFAFVTALPAQATILVGPGGLPQIRDALAVAAPGDVILVQPGIYAHFDATVPVTIRALTPGTVDVAYDVTFQTPNCSFLCLLREPITKLQPPAGATTHVVGIRFLGNVVIHSSGFNLRHRVEVLSGHVTLDQCEFLAAQVPPLSVRRATAHLQDCVVQPASFNNGAVGFYAETADVTAVDCLFFGGSSSGTAPGAQPYWGLRLINARMHGTHLLVTGGASPTGLGAAAVSMFGSATLWLSDSTLIAGPSQCVIEQAGTVRLDRCLLLNQIPGCVASPIGGTLLGVERSEPLSPGRTFQLVFHTEPNGLVAVFASPEVGNLDLPSMLEQPVWLDLAGAYSAALLVADATGRATVAWNIPVGPGITDRKLWLQGVSGIAVPLQASPLVGGVAR